MIRALVPSIATASLVDKAVTYAKIQDISATSRLLGRRSALAGVTEEVVMASAATPSTVVDRDAAGRAQFVDPAAAQDAATKAYVDAIAAGLDIKPSVLCATTANITLSGEQTIDGILTSASRVLVKSQTAPAQNGIYVSAAGAWTRATDMDSWTEVPGAHVFVERGTLNADLAYVATADQGGTLNTTAITWSQFGASASSFPATTYAKKTGAYVATTTDWTLLGDASGGAFSITLLDPTTCAGRTVWIGNVGASGTVTFTPAAGLIDGAASLKLTRPGDLWKIQSDGTNWIAVLRPPSVRLFKTQLAKVSHTGDTSLTILASIVIPANTLKAGSIIKIATVWSATNNANAKTIDIYFNGAGGVYFNQVVNASIASMASFNHERDLVLRDATNMVLANAGAGFGSSGSAPSTYTVDLTIDNTIAIAVTLGNAGDTGSLEYAIVTITDPAL